MDSYVQLIGFLICYVHIMQQSTGVQLRDGVEKLTHLSQHNTESTSQSTGRGGH